MIHQVDNGGDNSGKLPSGGVVTQFTVASSMSDAIANPITFYGGYGALAINQSGQSRDLYDYYWTSHSRGVDGWSVFTPNDPNRHNDYLDSYIPSRHKSIYDPCPYGYRTPSHGTYNEFPNIKWTQLSYSGGIIWNQLWFQASGIRQNANSEVGGSILLQSSTCADNLKGYSCWLIQGKSFPTNCGSRSFAVSIRCIEDCSVVSDATEASAGY